MKHIIIGDVHGCYDELLVLLDRYAEDRHVVFVGDLVDKGPKPHRCVELTKLLKATVVMGNHEENHLRYRAHEIRCAATGATNPMKRDGEFRRTHTKLLASSLDLFGYMQTFPMYHRIPQHNLVVVHGGLLPGPQGLWRPEDMHPKKICRVRNLKTKADGTHTFADLREVTADPTLPFWTELYNGSESVVYGHAVSQQVRVDRTPHGTCWGIDTGAVYGGQLTGLLLPEFETVSVPGYAYYEQKKY